MTSPVRQLPPFEPLEVQPKSFMRWMWDLIRFQVTFDLEIDSPADNVVQQLRSQVVTTGPSEWRLFLASVVPLRRSAKFPVEGYAGEVTNQGFIIRWFAQALDWLETRHLVQIRGDFRPEGDHTRVAVVIRHGRVSALFAWLLVVMVFPVGLIGPIRLWWDLRRFKAALIQANFGKPDMPAPSFPEAER